MFLLPAIRCEMSNTPESGNPFTGLGDDQELGGGPPPDSPAKTVRKAIGFVLMGIGPLVFLASLAFPTEKQGFAYLVQALGVGLCLLGYALFRDVRSAWRVIRDRKPRSSRTKDLED
jgi:hypothetical protein